MCSCHLAGSHSQDRLACASTPPCPANRTPHPMRLNISHTELRSALTLCTACPCFSSYASALVSARASVSSSPCAGGQAHTRCTICCGDSQPAALHIRPPVTALKRLGLPGSRAQGVLRQSRLHPAISPAAPPRPAPPHPALTARLEQLGALIILPQRLLLVILVHLAPATARRVGWGAGLRERPARCSGSSGTTDRVEPSPADTTDHSRGKEGGICPTTAPCWRCCTSTAQPPPSTASRPRRPSLVPDSAAPRWRT